MSSEIKNPLKQIFGGVEHIGELFKGLRGLIVGVANADSIAFGCARSLRELGADLALTYQNEKSKIYVEPLAQQLGAELLLPFDVTDSDQLTWLFHVPRNSVLSRLKMWERLYPI